MNNLKTEKNNEPIFIHSLFRSGSTYIFKKFRDKGELYTCFQEPVHEISLSASDDFEILNQGTGNKKNEILRHPLLEKSYFSELYNIAENTLHYLNKEDIYNNYFHHNVNSLCEYLQSIIKNSNNRCVIQECRLTSRMSGIKKCIGGLHLYLWRNPWDQWWSYKVTDYFDTVNLLILSSNNSPDIIEKIVKKLNIPKYHNDDVFQEFDFYRRHKLSAEDSYFTFYTIWLLSFIEALKNADFIFNIDKLSSCDEYKKLVSNEFCNKGIFGVNFSDCEVPLCTFKGKDIEFFSEIESKVHDLFLAVGYESELLNEILTCRKEFYPNSLHDNNFFHQNHVLRDSERAREIARNYITELSIFSKNNEIARQNFEMENNNKDLIIEENKARIYTIEQELKDNKQCYLEIEQELKDKKQCYDEILNNYNALLSSNSWLLTKPIRILFVSMSKIKDFIRILIKSPSFAKAILKRKVKAFVTFSLLKLRNEILKRDKLRLYVHSFLRKYPSLYKILKSLCVKVGLTNNEPKPRQTDSIALSPRAENIYSKITFIKEQKK